MAMNFLNQAKQSGMPLTPQGPMLAAGRERQDRAQAWVLGGVIVMLAGMLCAVFARAGVA